MNLRTVSYNIRNGHDVQHDMSLLAADLLAVQADIVGLQEVDVGTARVGGRDTLAELAKAAGFAHYRFCRAIDFAGGEYGTAILSRYPILSFEITPLPTPVGVEGRSGMPALTWTARRWTFSTRTFPVNPMPCALCS